MRRDAIDLVVRRHDRADRQLLHRPFERREEVLAQGALGDLGGADIGAVLGLAVAGHVLEGDEDLVLGQRQGRPLEAADGGQADLGADMRVLAIGLLDAAPARVAGHVDHRRQRQVRTAGAHLAGGDGEDLLGQLGVEGRGQGDGLREAGRVTGDIAVQGLVVHQQRDAQARLLHGPLLGGVGVARRLLGVAVDRAVVGAGRRVDHRGGLGALAVGRTRDLAQAIGEVLAGLLRRELALGGLDPVLGEPDADQLGGLLFQRHAGEQVLDPGVDRLGGVLVERLVGLGLGGPVGGLHEARHGGGRQRREARAEQAAGEGGGHPFVSRGCAMAGGSGAAFVKALWRQLSDHSRRKWYRSHFVGSGT